MNTKTKQILIIAGGILVCIALVVLIGSQFIPEKPDDNLVQTQESPNSDIYADDKADEITVAPPEIEDNGISCNGAISTGTEQTIQSEPDKPTYSDAQLKDPTQQPDGEQVTTTPTPVEHNQVTPPEPTAPTGGNPGQIYVPGFGWVDNHGGGTEQIIVDSDGDINKQVGDMG